MRKKILNLLKPYNPRNILFIRGDGNSVNWQLDITVNGKNVCVCYGYFVGDPNGRDNLIYSVQKEIANGFLGSV